MASAPVFRLSGCAGKLPALPKPSTNTLHAAVAYQAILKQVALDAEAVFTHPDIAVWRSIPERENGTLDAALADGRNIRLHIKRYHPCGSRVTPAQAEAQGIEALLRAGIATVPLVGWGNMADGRSFVITEDLAGYQAADKMIAGGLSPAKLDKLLAAAAALAARLHNAGLHHRDLYLCHFFARFAGPEPELRLIDAARVRRLPGWPLRRRWIVKDLAQFWYSAALPALGPERRQRWLEEYGRQRSLHGIDALRHSVISKAARIERHDKRLNAKQLGRNVSIPTR